MTTSFAAQVEDWVKEEKEALLAIVQMSTQEVVRLMKEPVAAGGNMPVDTSFLQNSLQGSSADVPPINPQSSGGQPALGNARQIEALIADMELGTTLYFGFTAAYAMRQNYGFVGTDALGRNYNQPGRHFVDLAVQRWPELVERYQRQLAGEMVFGG